MLVCWSLSPVTMSMICPSVVKIGLSVIRVWNLQYIRHKRFDRQSNCKRVPSFLFQLLSKLHDHPCKGIILQASAYTILFVFLLPSLNVIPDFQPNMKIIAGTAFLAVASAFTSVSPREGGQRRQNQQAWLKTTNDVVVLSVNPLAPSMTKTSNS
jgi:hypothetical protein